MTETALDQISATLGENSLQRLAELAAKDAGSPDAQQVHEMHGNMGGGTHLYRVSGGNDGSSWSYVLKIFDAPDDGLMSASTDPNAWHYWKREWLVYRTPWLHDLTGSLTPPVCIDTGVGDDGRLWIALEDQARHDDRPWLLERFGNVSHHIGEFNARYLDEASRPVEDWLTRGFIQGWTERSGPALEKLPSLQGNPIVDRIYPANIVDGLTRVWNHRDSLYRTLNELPQTLCHLDTNGRNLFAASDHHTIAIDWSYTGIAPLGQDLAGLIGGSLLLLEAPASRANELESLCRVNYLNGLGAGGWNGSERDVELGYLISLVLLYGIGPIGPALAVGLNEDLRPYAEAAFGHPVEEFTESVSRLATFALERFDRVLTLADF